MRVDHGQLLASVAGFWTEEDGTVTVDWAFLAAGSAQLALVAAGFLVLYTSVFQESVENTLKTRVTNVQPIASLEDRVVGLDDLGTDEDGEPLEFGFAGMSHRSSTSSSVYRSEADGCPPGEAQCGRASEMVSQEFLMNDGTVWTRVTTTSTGQGGDQAEVMWLDHNGRETTDVPTLPETIPIVTFN